MAMSWCKVSSTLDSHPKIRKAGRLGREVFLFALRRNAHPENPVPGILPADVLDPWFIADQLMMTEEEAVTGVTLCVTVGLLLKNGHCFEISGWSEDWGKRETVNAERQARYRARLRNDGEQGNPVTVENVTRYNVTVDQRRLEEKRREEITKNSATPNSASGLSPELFSPELEKPKVRQGRPKKPKPSEPTPAEAEAARTVLEKLTARNGVRYSSPEHTKLVVNQLRAGVSELELRAVIAYCAVELFDEPEMQKYLRPQTLFGPKTITKYLDPARTWAQKEYPQEFTVHSEPLTEPLWMSGGAQ
jgi:uncharacterized phage protein (TIGR02220 family)